MAPSHWFPLNAVLGAVFVPQPERQCNSNTEMSSLDLSMDHRKAIKIWAFIFDKGPFCWTPFQRNPIGEMLQKKVPWQKERHISFSLVSF